MLEIYAMLPFKKTFSRDTITNRRACTAEWAVWRNDVSTFCILSSTFKMGHNNNFCEIADVPEMNWGSPYSLVPQIGVLCRLELYGPNYYGVGYVSHPGTNSVCQERELAALVESCIWPAAEMPYIPLSNSILSLTSPGGEKNMHNCTHTIPPPPPPLTKQSTAVNSFVITCSHHIRRNRSMTSRNR